MDLMTGKRMVESCVFRKLIHKLLSECDALSQFILLLEDLFSHSLKLRTGKVPLVCAVSTLEVFFD